MNAYIIDEKGKTGELGGRLVNSVAIFSSQDTFDSRIKNNIQKMQY